MRKTVVLLWIVAFFSVPARAFDLELQAGVSRFQQSPCMLWNQDCAGYETHRHLTSGYARGSVAFPLRWQMEAHTFAYTLGHYSLDAIAADNEGCVLQMQQSSPNVCGNTARYMSSGSIAGIGESIRDYFRLFDQTIFAEYGVTYNRQTFRLDVTQKQSGFYDFHFDPGAVYGLGSVIGIGAEFKPVSIVLYQYRTATGGKFNNHCYPSGVGVAYALAVSTRF